MEVFWSEKLRLPFKIEFNTFLNQMSKRIAQGAARYGNPKPEKQYIKKLKLELSAYRKTGNHEHLINIANYAWLESVAPAHKRYHFDSGVDSATRGKV